MGERRRRHIVTMHCCRDWPIVVGAPVRPCAICGQVPQMAIGPKITTDAARTACDHRVTGSEDRARGPGCRRGYRVPPLRARLVLDWLR
jgi:hypothetical protein